MTAYVQVKAYTSVLAFILLITVLLIGSQELHNPGFGWRTSTDVNSRCKRNHAPPAQLHSPAQATVVAVDPEALRCLKCPA
jgi:hypothetical protein